jgi:hypothetical protein
LTIYSALFFSWDLAAFFADQVAALIVLFVKSNYPLVNLLAVALNKGIRFGAEITQV